LACAEASVSRVGILLTVSWALGLVQLLTVVPGAANTFLQPLSAEWGVLLVLYLVTGLCLLPGWARAPLVGVHLLAVGLLMLAHPLTTLFGRDGPVIVLAAHALAVLQWRTRLARELKLLAASLLVGLLLAEAALSGLHAPKREAGLLDYGDMLGAYGEAGFLKPRLNARVVGWQGPATFVTNNHGFRNRDDVVEHKRGDRYRVIFVGDSFVVGYRTDQDATAGKVMEDELKRRMGRRSVEVLVAGAGHPGAALGLVEKHLLDFEPDLLVVGITLGNDISQSWLERQSLPAEVLSSLFLPEDAFAPGYLGQFPARADRSLRTWRIYRRAAQAIETDVITPWFRDEPGHAHLFDPGHSLGHFFVRRPLPLVEQSFDALYFYMESLAGVAQRRGTPLLFALLPQRFQVTQREWQATVRRYALDAKAFDSDRPNRRILDACAARGLACVDLLPTFRQECASAGCYLPGGDMHWNSRGHAVAGRGLAAEVARLAEARAATSSSP
jgi:hypothetical protein